MLNIMREVLCKLFPAVLHNTSWSPILLTVPAPDDPYTIDMLKPQCEERVCKKQTNQVQHHDWHSQPREMPVARVMDRRDTWYDHWTAWITDMFVQVQHGFEVKTSPLTTSETEATPFRAPISATPRLAWLYCSLISSVWVKLSYYVEVYL